MEEADVSNSAANWVLEILLPGAVVQALTKKLTTMSPMGSFFMRFQFPANLRPRSYHSWGRPEAYPAQGASLNVVKVGFKQIIHILLLELSPS